MFRGYVSSLENLPKLLNLLSIFTPEDLALDQLFPAEPSPRSATLPVVILKDGPLWIGPFLKDRGGVWNSKGGIFCMAKTTIPWGKYMIQVDGPVAYVFKWVGEKSATIF